VHHIRNIGNENLAFVEIIHREYLGEDDIVKLEDKYGRSLKAMYLKSSYSGRQSILQNTDKLF
jgi:hypothetical protein